MILMVIMYLTHLPYQNPSMYLPTYFFIWTKLENRIHFTKAHWNKNENSGQVPIILGLQPFYRAVKVLVVFHTIFFIIFGPFLNISCFFSCLFTKMGYYKNFFVNNPILTKFGEIVVSMSTTISPNFVKIGLLTKKFL